MLNRYCRLLFLVFLCFVVTFTVNAQDAPENLLQNSDFENVGTAPWTMWVEDATAQAVMSIDKKEQIDGDFSLLIDVKKKGGGKRVELHQNPLTLKKGLKITYAMWAKVIKDDVRSARLVCNHRADPWTGYTSKNIVITEEWTEFWSTFTMPDTDALAGIYVEMVDVPGQVWFDHFRLYEGDYIKEELGGKPKAVDHKGKSAYTWGELKSTKRI
jgi:hypothetical protein